MYLAMAGKSRSRLVSKVSLGNSCLTTSIVPFMSHTDTEQRGTRIGYTRVSTVSQTLDQQYEALTAANVTKTFSDIMSGRVMTGRGWWRSWSTSALVTRSWCGSSTG